MYVDYPDMVQRVVDGACIPKNLENTDYQRYLEWLAAGNVPQPWEG